MTYTVLIVDDSKLARMAAARALNTLRPDWKQVEAANAREALECVRQHAPEVVLVDVNMPEKDGVTMAAEIHRLHPAIHIAVISANRQAEVIARARNAGATFLPKPLSEQALEGFLRSTGTSPGGASQDE